MIIVNNVKYSRDELLALPHQYAAWRTLEEAPSRRIAICLQEPLHVIALAHGLRTAGHSVLLLHGSTPYGSAHLLAAEAGCHGMIYGSLERCIELHRGSTSDTQGEQPTLYQYSSGTTGKPKLIGRPWTSIDEELTHYNARLEQSGMAELQPIVLASVAHSYGLIAGIFSAWKRGLEPIVYGAHHPKQLLQGIRDTPSHLLYAIPTLLPGICDWLQASGMRLDSVVTSGAPMPSGMFERCRAVAGTMIQQYGCTEAGCVSLAVGMESHDDLGVPLAHLTVDASTDPEQPSELHVSSGVGTVIATGDSGYRTAGGRLRFVARMDDLINVSGLKVRPQQVEEIIGRMPGIAEVVVYKTAHPLAGDRVAAQIIASHSVSEEQVKAWCLQHLPPYQVPSEIRMVDTFVRTVTGKISRKLLAEGG